MSKKYKKKFRMNSNNNVTVNKISKSPVAFFKNIGIKNLSENEFDRIIEKKGLDNFSYFECHETLPHAKLWWSREFNHICNIAEKLQQLDVPSNSKVLDVGGGPGHIAFWLRSIWDNCQITVADKFPVIGMEWANEIGIDGVNFIDSYMPELKGIDDHQYDIVLISRVIGNNISLSNIDNHSMEDFLKSHKGISIMQFLDNVAEGIFRVLAPDGRLIIVDTWSSDRIFLICKAFEKRGLNIDFDMFFPNISSEYSIVVFSTKDGSQLFDQALSLSTAIGIVNGKCEFHANAAESIKKVFETGNQLMLSEYFDNKHSIYVKDKIIEKNGLALYFRSTTAGLRFAYVSTAIDVKMYIEDARRYIEESVATNKIKIVQQIFPDP